MDTEVTLKCQYCGNEITRPVHVTVNGHMFAASHKLLCACCRQGYMGIVENKQSGCLTEKEKDERERERVLIAKTEPPEMPWFTEEPDIQQVLEQQEVLHMAKPLYQLHRSGELYHELLKVIVNEGVIRFPDGRTFVSREVNKDA